MAKGAEGPVVVLHECHANDDATLLPWRLIDRIVTELSARSTDYVEALAGSAGSRVEIKSDISIGNAVQSRVSGVSIENLRLGVESPRSMFARCVRKPLEAIGTPPAVVVIVDAVDETDSPGLDNEFANLLAGAIGSLGNSALDFRFMLTCRTVEQDRFGRLATEVVDLDRDEPRAGADMLLFCRSRLALTEGAHSDDRAWVVAGKAGGNYLYAKYAIDLVSGTTSAMSVAELPSGLGEMYHEFLVRRVANDLSGRQWRDRYRPVLGLVAVAREPGLTVQDLVGLLHLPESTVEDIVDDLSEFLRLDPRTARRSIFHDSFREFLLVEGTLRIKAAESHRRFSESFLGSAPELVSDYLSRNFAYHLHSAGMHLELCEYVISAERWRAHEKRAGVSLSARFTTLLTACESAIELDSPRMMAGLLLRDLELRAEVGSAAPDVTVHDADDLAHSTLSQVGEYDVNVMWQLVRACQELEAGTHGAASGRLDRLARWCDRSLGGDWQCRIGVLLAHLRVTCGSDGPVGELCHVLLDDVGIAYLKRYLVERGAIAPALGGPDIVDSHRYRQGVLRYAMDLSEKRRDPDGATAVARRVVAMARRSTGGPTLFEDMAVGAATEWLVGNEISGIDGLGGVLARLRDVTYCYADMLASCGRPEIAADAARRREGLRKLEDLRARSSRYPDRMWLDYFIAVALRRHGRQADARTLLRSLRGRLPALDAEPDGAFVADMHLDATHGPCLQGLVFLAAMEAATVRDFALAEDLVSDLLRFHSIDGVSALVHLIAEMEVAGETATRIGSVTDRLADLIVAHLDDEDAGVQLFSAGVALRDLAGAAGRFDALVLRGIDTMVESLSGRVVVGDRADSDESKRALAAALAQAFDAERDAATTNALLEFVDGHQGDEFDDVVGRFLGSVAGGRPVIDELDRITTKHSRDLHAARIRDHLADRDDLAAADAITARFDVADSLSVLSARIRAEARRGELAAVVRLCRQDEHPLRRAHLMLDAGEVITGGPHRLEGQVRGALAEASRFADSIRSGDRRSVASMYYFHARLLARAGLADRAVTTHILATNAYEASVDWIRMMSIRMGGNRYLQDGTEDADYDELEDNIATTILDADRCLSVELVRGRCVEEARDVVLGMAGLGGGLIEYHRHRAWTVAGANELTRVSIAARAAAECGFADILQQLLSSEHDRGATAAWVANRMLDAPAWHQEPRTRQAMLIRLCANALGRRDAATTALAHLVMAAPEAATSIEPSRWLAVLRRGDAARVDDVD